jgi:hypothetical protein
MKITNYESLHYVFFFILVLHHCLIYRYIPRSFASFEAVTVVII